jgi:hypothetical protein
VDWPCVDDGLTALCPSTHRLDDAYITLGEALQALEDWDEAVRVLRRGSEAFQGDGRMQEALRKAEIALKQSKEVNYYKVCVDACGGA